MERILGRMKKKITTIEDLAVLLEGEFRRIDGEFQKVNKRFDALEIRMDRLEARVDKSEATLKAEIALLRKGLREIDTRTAVIALEVRVSKLEGTV